MNYVQLSMADLPKKIRYDSDDKFLAFIQSIRGTSTDIERIFFFVATQCPQDGQDSTKIYLNQLL